MNAIGSALTLNSYRETEKYKESERFYENVCRWIYSWRCVLQVKEERGGRAGKHFRWKGTRKKERWPLIHFNNWKKKKVNEWRKLGIYNHCSAGNWKVQLEIVPAWPNILQMPILSSMIELHENWDGTKIKVIRFGEGINCTMQIEN